MASTLGQHSCAGHHTYLVEATNSARANDRPPIIVANAIVAPKVADGSVPLVPIWLANPSPDPITLRRGTKVAQVVPILESELITGISYDSGSISATTVTNKELPLEAKEALWKMVEDCREVLDSHQQQELYTFLLGFADVFAFTDAELAKGLISCSTPLPQKQSIPSAHQLGEFQQFTRRKSISSFKIC